MPSPPPTARRIIRFGLFELDAYSGELRKAGARLNVQEQPLQVLKVLLERPGELVTREDLRQRLWPSDTFVGFEHGLNAAVGRLRETLGDSADTPRFIETLPRRGYRFIGTVVGDETADSVRTAPESLLRESTEEPAAAKRPAEVAKKDRRVLPWTALTSAGLAVLVASWGAYSLGKRAGDRPHPTFRQLTFRRGGVVSARFTPDGKTVIYGAAWDGEPVRLFSTRIEGPESSSLPLPDADVADISSAAEMLIVINRPYVYALAPGTLARVPLAGGTPRPIAEGVGGADWSSDGKQFAVSRVVDGIRWHIEYPLGTRLYETTGGAWGLRISPGGNRVAFYGDGKNPGDAAVVMVDRTGHTTILSDGWRWAGRYVAWSARGDEVWFSATKSGDRKAPLSAVSISGQERVVLSLPGFIDLQDIAADGRVLLTYASKRRQVRCRIAGEGQERDLSWFGFSGAEDLSRDGKTLLFGELDSPSGQNMTAYVRRTDGSPALRLGNCRPIDLSPDGKWVSCHDELADQVLHIPTGPGEAKTVPRRGEEERGFGLHWLPDSKHKLGAWREKGARFQTYFVDIDGAPPQLVTPEGVCTWASPDGNSALCEPDADGTSRIYSLDRKEFRPVRGLHAGDDVISWAADNRSLFIRAHTQFPIRVYRLDTDSGDRTFWRQIDPPDRAGLIYDWMTVYMTPDGASYCYTTQNALNDLYLVEGLR